MASGPLARTAGTGLEGSLPSLSPTTTASIPRELLLVALQRARLLAGHQFEVQLQLGNQALRVEVRGGEWTAVQERIPATVTGRKCRLWLPAMACWLTWNGPSLPGSGCRLRPQIGQCSGLPIRTPNCGRLPKPVGALMEESPATTPHPGTSQPVGQTPRWPRAVLDPQ
jgi:hypothetical protein